MNPSARDNAYVGCVVLASIAFCQQNALVRASALIPPSKSYTRKELICLQKRPIKVTFRVNESERSRLNTESTKAGLPKEEFIRRLIMGVELQPRPPEQLTDLLRHISAIGNNINQIARIANGTGHVSEKDLEYIRSNQSEIWQMLKAL